MDQWGLTKDSMTDDPWDYVHITTFNFLPFLLARVGKAAAWVVHLLTIVWFAALAATIALLLYIRKALAANTLESAPQSVSRP